MLNSKFKRQINQYLLPLFAVALVVLIIVLMPADDILQSQLLTVAASVLSGIGVWLYVRQSLSLSGGQTSPEVLQATHKILQTSLDGIITVNNEGIVTEFNPAAEHIFGYTAEYAKGRNLTELIIPKRLVQKHSDSFAKFIATGEKNIIGTRVEIPALRSNDDEFPVEMTLTTIEQNGEVVVTAFLRDLTERKKAEEGALVAYTVFSKASEGIMVTNRDNQIKAVNPAFLKITGYDEEEVIGRNPSILSSGRHDESFYNNIWGQLSEKGAWEGEIWNRRKNGDIYPQYLSIAVVRDSGGSVSDHVAVFTDITQRKETETQIIHQATHDPLTELPNRILFFDRLNQAMAAGRREGRSIAVLFVDLDKFKPVNDEHGHLFGDALLTEVAGRLTSVVREVDTVARYGGDEFALVLTNHDSKEFTHSVSRKLLDSIKRPYVLNGREIVIGCSIGIALFPKNGCSADELVYCADQAMYRAKSRGGNACEYGRVDAETRRVVEGGETTS